MNSGAGTTTFGGAIGGTTRLTSLTTDVGGTTVFNSGNISTTGAITINDPLTLGAATTLDSNGSGNMTLASTVNGAEALVVNTSGTTIFGGAVGGVTALSSVTTNAGGSTQINGGSIRTTGAQTYSDAVTLGANTTLTVGGNLTFSSTVRDDGTAGNASLTAAVTGTTTLGADVGGDGGPLTSLDLDTAGPLNVGVNITITPRIHSEREISMKVAVDVSSVAGRVNIGGIEQPIISQRKIEHDIRLQEGEVNVLAGLIERSQTKSVEGWPGLSKIPFLRYFFSSESRDEVESEVLIVLTPRIVRLPEIRAENLRSTMMQEAANELRRSVVHVVFLDDDSREKHDELLDTLCEAFRHLNDIIFEDHARFIEMDHHVELPGELRVEVMAQALGLGPVYHTDGAFEQVLIQNVGDLSALKIEKERIKLGLMKEPLYRPGHACVHAFELRGFVPVRSGGHRTRSRRPPSDRPRLDRGCRAAGERRCRAAVSS